MDSCCFQMVIEKNYNLETVFKAKFKINLKVLFVGLFFFILSL